MVAARRLSKKPSLPVGTHVAGFPDVKTALHSDGDCEVYLLDQTDVCALLLVLVPLRAESQNALRAWWPSLAPAVEVKCLFRTSPSAPSRAEAIVKVAGQCLGNRQDEEIDERTLTALLSSLVGLAERTAGTGLFPRLEPWLLWKSFRGGGTIVASILPTQRSDEPKLVWDLGSTFYWLACGIEPGGSPQPLSNWCKAAGTRLSSIVGRCLMPAAALGGIDSVAALRNALSEPVPLGGRIAPRTHPPEKVAGLSKVAGMSRLKALLERDVVKPLRDPEPFRRYGLSIPNGLLLYGPPGCGKTYISRQLAEELGYFFVEIIPSEVAGMHIHESVLKIREVFDTAAERAPSIVFIDEVDALVPARAGLGGHQQYKSEEVNEFLTQLSGCAERGIFVIAATNEPGKIDQAVRRTGRFDKLVYVGPPDNDARIDMLRLHLGSRPVEPDIDLRVVSQGLSGYSASDIKFLIDEAARLALFSGVQISAAILHEASSGMSPSISSSDEQRYRSFEERGAS